MLDIGWTELLVVGVLALIIVGPKDLPRVLRYVGYWVGKARSMAREFQRALDQYAKEADLDDVKKAVETPSRAKSAVKKAIDPTGSLAKDMKDTESSIKSGLDDAAKGRDAKPNGKAAETASEGGAASAETPTEPPKAPTAPAPQSTADGQEDKPKAHVG